MAKTRKRASSTRKPPAAFVTGQSVQAFLTHDRIAVRAYELFLRRDRQHGSDQEDWLLAERELMSGVAHELLSAAPDYAG